MTRAHTWTSAEMDHYASLLKSENAILLNTLLVSHREAKGFKQAAFATRVLYTNERTYRDWERGLNPIPPDMLPIISRELDMDQRHHWMLYQLTLGYIPPEAAKAPLQSNRTFIGDLRTVWELTKTSSLIAYFMDPDFNVRLYNRRFMELYGWTCSGSVNDPTSNMVRFVLFKEEAPKVLVNHFEDWLVPALIFYNIGAKKYPTRESYLNIRREMDQHPDVLHAQKVVLPEAMARRDEQQPTFEKRMHKMYWPGRSTPVLLDSSLLSLDNYPDWRFVVDRPVVEDDDDVDPLFLDILQSQGLDWPGATRTVRQP